jgi:structural maintenance of chromosome 2
LQALQQEMDELDFNAKEEAGLQSLKDEMERRIRDLSATVESYSAKLEGRLNFEFQDPVKGFDRSKVKGMVAKLVRMIDPTTATALEVCVCVSPVAAAAL